MYFKFIKFVVLLSLLVCCGFAGRVLYSCSFNLAVQGKEPRLKCDNENNKCVLNLGLMTSRVHQSVLHLMDLN